jgi:hypothetical protein
MSNHYQFDYNLLKMKNQRLLTCISINLVIFLYEMKNTTNNIFGRLPLSLFPQVTNAKQTKINKMQDLSNTIIKVNSTIIYIIFHFLVHIISNKNYPFCLILCMHVSKIKNKNAQILLPHLFLA